MIQIRRGVFETNSSSSHSIVLTKKENSKPEGMIDPGYKLDTDGILHFYSTELEFGRSPFELLTDWEGRLRYAIASYANDRDLIDNLETICYSRIMGFNGFSFQRSYEGGNNYGWIDHQSAGLLQHALRKYNVSLEDFIFDDRFVVVIDGDEYNIFDTFMGTDMFNKDSIEDITSASWEIEDEYWNDRKNENVQER